MRVRPFRPADAPHLAELFHRSAREAGVRHYRPEQVRAWSPAPPEPATYFARAAERHLFVAAGGGGRVLSYADLAPDGYIDHLYCHPDHVGQGVGTALLAALEAEAVRGGVARLWADASEGACRLFERHGFVSEGRQGFTLHGVPIHNHRMSKVVGEEVGSSARSIQRG